MSRRGVEQSGFWEAVVRLVAAPFMSLAVGILFVMVGRIYVAMQPRAADSAFRGAYETIGTILSVSHSLIQLVSSIETWVALGVLCFAGYSFVAGLGGRRGRGGSRNQL